MGLIFLVLEERGEGEVFKKPSETKPFSKLFI